MDSVDDLHYAEEHLTTEQRAAYCRPTCNERDELGACTDGTCGCPCHDHPRTIGELLTRAAARGCSITVEHVSKDDGVNTADPFWHLDFAAADGTDLLRPPDVATDPQSHPVFFDTLDALLDHAGELLVTYEVAQRMAMDGRG